MLTRTMTAIALGVLSLGAIACENKPSSESTNPPSNAAPPTPATATNPVTNTNATVPIDPLAKAENKDKVKQYPDETRFTPARPARLITGFAAETRESPAGDSMSALETTQEVTEVARDAKGNYYLIVYADPKDSTKQLAGWVHRDALENTSWSQTPPSAGKALSNTMASKLDCSRGQAHVRTDRDFCAKTCKDDKVCDKDKGEICDGLGFEVHETSGKLTNIRYCISSASPHAENENAPSHGPSDMTKPSDISKPIDMTK